MQDVVFRPPEVAQLLKDAETAACTMTRADEVERVAPVWNPNRNDGVIINFTPLWHLVPQNKAWQKLKSTWGAVSDGKYNWAHLAMHIWPEHGVLKCAKDRNLAIAHGLESVFWVQDAGGKGSPIPEPRSLTPDLKLERASPAVKSSLRSLLEAPAVRGSGKKVRKGKAHA